MTGKLFSQRFLPFFTLLLLGSALSVNAQTTLTTGGGTPTIITGGNSPYIGVAAQFITFEVVNDNPCPIAVTNINNYHVGQQAFGNPTQFILSNNDSSYNLFVTYSTLTGPPVPIDKTNGWEFVRNSGPINTATTNGIASVFDSIKVVIQPNSRARFCVQTFDTMAYVLNSVPISVSSNNVTLISGTSNVYGGFYPGGGGASYFNYSTISSKPVSLNFIGSVTTVQLPPYPPQADVALKPIHKCIGDDVVLRATHTKPGGIFTWKDSKGNVLSTNSTGTHTITNVQLSDAGKYYVTYKLCGLESDADSVVLIVNDPQPPTVSGKFDYCLNEQFEPVTVHGLNVKWYYVDTGGSPVPVTPTINTSSPNTLFYYVSQTDSYGCESRNRTLVRFRAARPPAPPIVTTPIYYCEGGVSDAVSALGDTLRWYYFPHGGVATEKAPVPNTSKRDSFQYYVTQTIDGCESVRSRIDVVVTFRPNGLIRLTKDNLCAKDTLTVSYYGSADSLKLDQTAQYNWTLPNGTQLLNSDGHDEGPMILQLDSPGKQQITLRVGHVGCLSELYSEDITVKPLPYGKISIPHDVCLGQPELIECVNYTPRLDTFFWDFDGGETTHFTTDQGPYGVYWTTEGKKAIKVRLIDNECITDIADTLTVHQKPDATITAELQAFDGNQKRYVIQPFNNGDEMCASDSLKVTVSNVEPGATYKWTPSRFFDNNTDKPVTYARVDFTSNIYVEVEDIYGCKNMDSMKVNTKSCCEMVFPNAFTPNNDGKNDKFRPITVGRRQVKTFKVMNRYGQAIYESNQAQQGWDGTLNGKPSDVGTYFYLISFDCEGKNVDQAGEVILVR